MNEELKMPDDQYSYGEVPSSGTKTKIVIISVIVCTLIGVAFAYSYFFILPSNESEQERNDEQEIQDTLSDEEVFIERHNLPSISNNELMESKYGTTVKSYLNTPDDDHTKKSDTPGSFTPQDEIERSAEEQPADNPTPSTETATNGTSADSTASTEMTSNDPSVKMGETTVQNTTHTGEPEPLTYNGVVRLVDYDQQVLVIGDPGTSPYQINTLPETTITLNGKLISFNELKTFDIVTVTGMGYPASSQLDADNISITGTYVPPEPAR